MALNVFGFGTESLADKKEKDHAFLMTVAFCCVLGTLGSIEVNNLAGTGLTLAMWLEIVVWISLAPTLALAAFFIYRKSSMKMSVYLLAEGAINFVIYGIWYFVVNPMFSVSHNIILILSESLVYVVSCYFAMIATRLIGALN